VDHRLVLRDAETLEVIFMQDCVDKIQRIEWSHDSDHILCAMYKKGKVQCFRSTDDDWRCAIDEGPAGIVFAKWAPCGTRILCVTEFKLRVSVWSLLDTSCVYIKSPKFDDGRGLDFSPDGKFLAFVERKRCTDSILIVDAETWTTSATFGVVTEDLADAQWSPDSTSISVFDAPHACALVLYSPDGRVLREFKTDESAELMKTKSFSSYAHDAGVLCQRWSSGGSFLAAGGRDRRVRVLNHVSWHAFADLRHADRIVTPAAVAVYEEVEEQSPGGTVTENQPEENVPLEFDAFGDLTGAAAKNIAGSGWSRANASRDGTFVPRYAVRPLPVSVPATTRLRGEGGEGDEAGGVDTIEWSFDDRFLATRDSGRNRAVWIWDMVRMELCAVLIQTHPVLEIKWDPRKNRLAVVTGLERVYVWSPDGASFVQIPLPGFAAHSVGWNPNGSSFALGDKGTFCCAFP
jgi:WD40 repeat protein